MHDKYNCSDVHSEIDNMCMYTLTSDIGDISLGDDHTYFFV